jgi:hypothetical protein
MYSKEKSQSSKNRNKYTSKHKKSNEKAKFMLKKKKSHTSEPNVLISNFFLVIVLQWEFVRRLK